MLEIFFVWEAFTTSHGLLDMEGGITNKEALKAKI